MKKAFLLIATILGLVSLTGCTNLTHFTKMDAAEPLIHGRLSFPVDAGWARHTQMSFVGRAMVTRYVRLDAPTVAMDLEAIWTLTSEVDTGRRNQRLQPKELGDYVKTRHTGWITQAGGIVTGSSVETVDFAGHPGFKVSMDYTTYNGLEMRVIMYGAVRQEYIYWMSYEADLINNFDRFLPAFMTSVRQAKLVDRSCTMGIYCL